SWETVVLTGIYNTWEVNNTPLMLYNNFSLNDNDLEQLKYDIINEYDSIIPPISEIPRSDYNLDLNNRNDVLDALVGPEIRLGNYLILTEGDGMELGRLDLILNKIFLRRIINY
ncbi:hypothetical protein LCGC14_1793090, partial [marine sediment metagenome]